MYNIVERYMEKLTINDVDNFARQKGAVLSAEELDFTYTFIKKNWKDVFKNPKILDLDRYAHKFQPDNFRVVKQVFNEYYQRFGSLLK